MTVPCGQDLIHMTSLPVVLSLAARHSSLCQILSSQKSYPYCWGYLMTQTHSITRPGSLSLVRAVCNRREICHMEPKIFSLRPNSFALYNSLLSVYPTECDST